MASRSNTKRRWYGHPFVIGGLGLLLLLDLLSIKSNVWENSTIKHDVLGLPKIKSSAHERPLFGRPIRTENEIEWRWLSEEDPYEPTPDAFSYDVRSVSVFVDITRSEGTYHFTRRVEQYFLHADGLSAEDEQAILDAVLEAIYRDPTHRQMHLGLADMIRAGVRKRTFPIYSGYVRNTLAGLVAVAFVVCCARGRPWEWFRDPVLGIDRYRPLRAHRRRRGLCDSCGYDLAGLDSDRCPECGSEAGS